MSSAFDHEAGSCPLIEDLTSFVTGELDEQAMSAICSHLEHCSVCDSRVQILEAGEDRLSRELKRLVGPASFRNEPQMNAALAKAKQPQHITDSGPVLSQSRWNSDGSLILPQELGHYRLTKLLGTGGMGAVYEATHSRLQTRVAVKVMAQKSLENIELLQRFEREAKGLARLDHPHIVRALDAGASDDVHYFVMELIHARDLSLWIKQYDRLPLEWVCECIRQAAQGLAFAHKNGVIHRDVKPSNMLVIGEDVTSSPTLKIADLGLARIISSEPRRPESLSTKTGQIMGTPDYIAPEQVEDTKNADARSDIFSLGCTLFQMLCGELPFRGGSIQDRLHARLLRDAPRVKSIRPELPAVLDAIVERMLRRDPGARYQFASDIAEAIGPFARSAESRVPATFKTTTGTDYKPGRRSPPVAQPKPFEMPRAGSPDASAPKSPPVVLPSTAPLNGGAELQTPRRDLRNQQLLRFYTSLTLQGKDLCDCEGCGLLVPNRRLSLSIGSHLLMAVQERSSELAAFTIVMAEMLGRDFVTIPQTPSGYVVFLDQFAALPCASCQTRLCPACLTGGTLKTGCVVCRYSNQPPPVNFDVGPLESVVDKMHAATVLAAITHLGAASDMEFDLMQQVVLGSAKKMQKDAASGQPVTWLGLALREFCRAVESFEARPVNKLVLQDIRQICDACLRRPIPADTVRDFQETVKQYVNTRI